MKSLWKYSQHLTNENPKQGAQIMKITCAVDQIRGLTADEIKAILEKDKRGEFLLLYVRQPEEYKAGHIPGATLIPLRELETIHRKLHRNKRIIAFCCCT